MSTLSVLHGELGAVCKAAFIPQHLVED